MLNKTPQNMFAQVMRMRSIKVFKFKNLVQDQIEIFYKIKIKC